MKYKEQDNLGYRTVYNARVEQEKFLDEVPIEVADFEAKVKYLKEKVKLLEESNFNLRMEIESFKMGYY